MAINRSPHPFLDCPPPLLLDLETLMTCYLILSGYSASSRVRLRRFSRGGFTWSVLKKVIFISIISNKGLGSGSGRDHEGKGRTWASDESESPS